MNNHSFIISRMVFPIPFLHSVIWILLALFSEAAHGTVPRVIDGPQYTQHFKKTSFTSQAFLDLYSSPFFIDKRWRSFSQYKWNLVFIRGLEIRSQFILKYLHFMQLSSLTYQGKRLPSYIGVNFHFMNARKHLLGRRNMDYVKKHCNSDEVQQFQDFVAYAILLVGREPNLKLWEDELDEKYILSLIQFLLENYIESSRIDPGWKDSWNEYTHEIINCVAARFFLREHLSGTRIPVDDDFRCLVYTNLFGMNQEELRKIMELARGYATYPVAWKENVEATSLDELCRLWQQELQRLKRKEPSDGQKKLP